MIIKYKIFIMLFLALFTHTLKGAVATLKTESNKPIFEYSANQLQNELQQKWSWKEKLGWWIARKQIKKARKRALSQSLSQIAAADDTNCYTIRLKDGTTQYARDIRIRPMKLYYFDCGYPEKRKSINKENIDYVLDLKGTVVYDQSMMFDPDERKIEAFSLIGIGIIILVAFSFAFFPSVISVLIALLGGLLGFWGFARAMVYPEKYKNKWVAILGLLLAIGIWGAFFGFIFSFGA